jgi:hypothetical protein
MKCFANAQGFPTPPLRGFGGQAVGLGSVMVREFQLVSTISWYYVDAQRRQENSLGQKADEKRGDGKKRHRQPSRPAGQKAVTFLLRPRRDILHTINQ